MIVRLLPLLIGESICSDSTTTAVSQGATPTPPQISDLQEIAESLSKSNTGNTGLLEIMNAPNCTPSELPQILQLQSPKLINNLFIPELLPNEPESDGRGLLDVGEDDLEYDRSENGSALIKELDTIKGEDEGSLD